LCLSEVDTSGSYRWTRGWWASGRWSRRDNVTRVTVVPDYGSYANCPEREL